MIHIQVDEDEVRDLYLKAIDEKVEKVDAELTFWDTKELKRRTRMSWNTIQDTFFYDENFPKYKVGGKWFYPAKEANQFLLEWLKRNK